MTDVVGGAMTESNSGFMVGDVLGRTFSTLGRNLVPFLIIAAVAAIPNLILNWNTVSGPGAPTQIFARLGWSLSIGGLVQLLTQAIILHAAFQDMLGRPIRIGESIRVGFSRFLPIFGLSFLMGVGIILGMMVLLVPGLILLTMWAVALPACVVETQGPIGSLGRSVELTKGHRWKLFGLLFLLWIVSFVLGGLSAVVGKMLGGQIGVLSLQFIVQTVLGAFQAILVIVIYRDLRVAKEGIGTEQIAAVFD